jgi:hypothetical protein
MANLPQSKKLTTHRGRADQADAILDRWVDGRRVGTDRQPIISLTERTKCIPFPLALSSAARASAAAFSE